MPDIKDKEKKLIRTKTKIYSSILSKVSFEQGVTLHLKTYNALSLESARCRICLMCGKVGSLEDFEQHEDCSSTYAKQKIPLVIKTSWYKLREFFLTEQCCDFFKYLGIKEGEIKEKWM